MNIWFTGILLFLTNLNFTHPALEEPREDKKAITYPSLFYEVQIAMLNQNTELELFFDEEVENYINLFLTERHEIFIQYLKRADLYFPIFERYLSSYQIPPEIKYLPVLESGLSPHAVSPSLAVGLWQFKEPTGSSFGLKIDENVDERTNPELSTIAACKYLTYLNSSFNNWHLSLLAYVSGPTTIRNAQKQVNQKDNYFELYPYLTRPAQKYLPALVAIIYLFNNAEYHFDI